MKAAIFLGVTIGGLLGGWVGSLLDHGTVFGVWSILMSGVGSVVGIWAGYRAGKRWF